MSRSHLAQLTLVRSAIGNLVYPLLHGILPDQTSITLTTDSDLPISRGGGGGADGRVPTDRSPQRVISLRLTQPALPLQIVATLTTGCRPISCSAILLPT